MTGKDYVRWRYECNFSLKLELEIMEGGVENHGGRNKMSGGWNRISWKVTLKIMEEGTK